MKELTSLPESDGVAHNTQKISSNIEESFLARDLLNEFLFLPHFTHFNFAHITEPTRTDKSFPFQYFTIMLLLLYSFF